ncbi:UDP-N-acetylglucosamine 2-epimerase (non-hydrolyzing) [Aetokthonos hydrillicola Thurmond2011]|jgi:UDP-N-acetylglucosamine 2-epimerase|uniref:UDP-N-acetylglucosamine 2-epimerase (Non-hydrolyzing) n=1 Tax=Aetokthonos hydrillicola Thurmond2011 TaxID=2712845 RepID=A0AAP5IF07_9CYAN|nr:UDP-N-acetylglucosamine 2-epimerase (non-hydrolyzing) [Aetokthonos hydrillicola]MBO3463429.1 UDP-N-acetylglucosamine 2-epimerase (non-hydrolyzing) [Aetokthonos hydrillicola CCALA 1050]MBW4585695.1 UDP-N-acetylglucosamine 2-epimerase (non-hydrolyzing) [Aetokthonos hydrillicola CCALA 1050]MDR9899199.1 UDP-N-acetylglucosamine 2-epimerase (non-hydrolyzing) [Aetokthonos hydrillicola Thurmond2011]
MKVITILGARPQFIKASVVSTAFRRAGINEVIIHTGQHFDSLMSDIFFQDLDLPQPHYNLDIHSLNHGAMTGRMMEKIEEILLEKQPDWVCVYGDTNSTLAGALVAAKLNIRLAHIEAGLRSFNRQMPEEVNRVVTDHLSQLLFAPTPLAVQCLEQEGIFQGVHLVGDVMKDAILSYHATAKQTSDILARYQLTPDNFYLATIHRPSNTDDSDRLSSILGSFTKLDFPVVFPIHPRTQSQIRKMSLSHYLETDSIVVIPPVSYLDMLVLESASRSIVTDSGGIQKEAYIFGKPCFTIRNETEWKETLELGWNQLVQPEALSSAIANFAYPSELPTLYGDGDTASKITDIMVNY